ncbi:MAG TPA: hypothetical protein VMZ26_01475 [Pyrinomonadaceae bacterium]|nr:hypothetical protein [Pyrinomonadaceae bacterium]
MKTVSLLAILFAVFVIAVAPVAGQEKPKNPLVGNWLCEDEGTKVEIRANGTLTIDGTEYAYKIKNSVINVVGEDGAMAIPFQLDGDTLTVDVSGHEMVYTRVKAGAKSAPTGSASSGASAAGVMQALVGKWCYMSNLTGSNSYMSSRCFVLYANGTYEYSAESSSGGAYGSTAGQSRDSGRWSATATTLTAFSNSQGKMVYPIELRNHPKTGDAMIVVDGDAYVTATQRRPW